MHDFLNAGRAKLHIHFLAALKKIYTQLYKRAVVV